MAESNNLMQALQTLIESETSQMNTAVDAVIERYDAGIASVRPLPKQKFIDGTTLDYPVIPNVPVVWPRFAGDSAGVKGPVKTGDKCLLIFCQQAVDGSDDERRFSLNDAYCIVGAFGKTIGRGAENDQMQLYYGDAYIALTEEGKLLINAPAGVEITAPETLNSGRLVTQGELAYQAGMSGTGGASVIGSISATGDINAGNISVRQHTHLGNGSGRLTGAAQ
jgi:hypothetical protein